jgi:aspartate aminotransferase/aminotransferase
MPTPAKHLVNITQAMSIRYNNMVYDLQARGEDVVVLSLGEAFFDIPLFSFTDLPMPASYHYSHSRGIPDLRSQLANYYRNQYGVPVEPMQEMIITAGSKIAVHMALMAILNPGDEVLYHEPALVSYPEQVKLCHAVPVPVPQEKSVFDFGDYITERTKAIIINNPNNPRGNVLSRDEVQHLHALARKHDVYLLSDEAYSDFLLRPEQFISCGVLDPEKKHTIICNSMSKNYGMSGWRIGYVITNSGLTAEILKINQHLVTCPATILEFYLSRHFEDILRITKPQIAAVVQKRLELTRFMDAIGLTYLPGDATFYLFVSIAPSKLGSEEFCERLLHEAHVCVVPGIGYGASCDSFVRVSVGTESMERTKRGLEAVRRLVDDTSDRGLIERGKRQSAPASA